MQSLYDARPSSLVRLLLGVQQGLFGLGLTLSKEQPVIKHTFVAMNVVDGFQIAAFAIGLYQGLPWAKSEGVTGLGTAITYVTSTETSNVVSIDFQRAFLLVAVFWTAIVVTACVSVGWRFVSESPQSEFLLKGLRTFGLLSVGVLYLPFVGALIRGTACDEITDDWLGLGLACANPIRIVMATAMAVLAFFFSVVAIFVSATFVDRNPKSQSWAAKTNGRLDVAVLLVKLILSITYSLFPSIIGAPMLSILLVAIGFGWFWSIIRTLPYMWPHMNSIMGGTAAGFVLWPALALTYVQTVPGQADADNSVLVLLGIVACAAIGGLVVHTEQNRIYHLRVKDVRTLPHLAAWSRRKIQQAMMDDRLANEQDSLSMEDVPLVPQAGSADDVANTVRSHARSRFQSRQRLLLEAEQAVVAAIQRFPLSADAQVLLSLFEQQFSLYYTREAAALARAAELSPSMDTKFYVFLRSKTMASGSSELNPVERLLFDQQWAEARELRIQVYRSTQRLWEGMAEPRPSVKALLASAMDIDTRSTRVEILFARLFKSLPDSPKLLRAMAEQAADQNELNRALDLGKRAERLLDRFGKRQTVGSGRAFEMLHGVTADPDIAAASRAHDSAATLTISMAPSSLGEIVFASIGAARLLQFSGQQLTGLNISTIIPAPFRETHTDMLSRFLQHGRCSLRTPSRIVGRRNMSLVVTRPGFIVPVWLSIVEAGPDASTLSPRMAAMLEPIDSKESFMLLAADGTLLAADATSCSLLSVDPEDLGTDQEITLSLADWVETMEEGYRSQSLKLPAEAVQRLRQGALSEFVAPSSSARAQNARKQAAAAAAANAAGMGGGGFGVSDSRHRQSHSLVTPTAAATSGGGIGTGRGLSGCPVNHSTADRRGGSSSSSSRLHRSAVGPSHGLTSRRHDESDTRFSERVSRSSRGHDTGHSQHHHHHPHPPRGNQRQRRSSLRGPTSRSHDSQRGPDLHRMQSNASLISLTMKSSHPNLLAAAASSKALLVDTNNDHTRRTERAAAAAAARAKAKRTRESWSLAAVASKRSELSSKSAVDLLVPPLQSALDSGTAVAVPIESQNSSGITILAVKLTTIRAGGQSCIQLRWMTVLRDADGMEIGWGKPAGSMRARNRVRNAQRQRDRDAGTRMAGSDGWEEEDEDEDSLAASIESNDAVNDAGSDDLVRLSPGIRSSDITQPSQFQSPGVRVASAVPPAPAQHRQFVTGHSIHQAVQNQDHSQNNPGTFSVSSGGPAPMLPPPPVRSSHPLPGQLSAAASDTESHEGDGGTATTPMTDQRGMTGHPKSPSFSVGTGTGSMGVPSRVASVAASPLTGGPHPSMPVTPSHPSMPVTPSHMSSSPAHPSLVTDAHRKRRGSARGSVLIHGTFSETPTGLGTGSTPSAVHPAFSLKSASGQHNHSGSTESHSRSGGGFSPSDRGGKTAGAGNRTSLSNPRAKWHVAGHVVTLSGTGTKSKSTPKGGGGGGRDQVGGGAISRVPSKDGRAGGGGSQLLASIRERESGPGGGVASDQRSVGSSSSTAMMQNLMKALKNMRTQTEPEVRAIRWLLAMLVAMLFVGGILSVLWLGIVNTDLTGLQTALDRSSQRLEALQTSFAALVDAARNGTGGISAATIEQGTLMTSAHARAQAMRINHELLQAMGDSGGMLGRTFDSESEVELNLAGVGPTKVLLSEAVRHAQASLITLSSLDDGKSVANAFEFEWLRQNIARIEEILERSIAWRMADLQNAAPTYQAQVISIGVFFFVFALSASFVVISSSVTSLRYRTQRTFDLLLPVPRKAAKALAARATSRLERLLAESTKEAGEMVDDEEAEQDLLVLEEEAEEALERAIRHIDRVNTGGQQQPQIMSTATTYGGSSSGIPQKPKAMTKASSRHLARLVESDGDDADDDVEPISRVPTGHGSGFWPPPRTADGLEMDTVDSKAAGGAVPARGPVAAVKFHAHGTFKAGSLANASRSFLPGALMDAMTTRVKPSTAVSRVGMSKSGRAFYGSITKGTWGTRLRLLVPISTILLWVVFCVVYLQEAHKASEHNMHRAVGVGSGVVSGSQMVSAAADILNWESALSAVRNGSIAVIASTKNNVSHVRQDALVSAASLEASARLLILGGPSNYDASGVEFSVLPWVVSNQAVGTAKTAHTLVEAWTQSGCMLVAPVDLEACESVEHGLLREGLVAGSAGMAQLARELTVALPQSSRARLLLRRLAHLEVPFMMDSMQQTRSQLVEASARSLWYSQTVVAAVSWSFIASFVLSMPMVYGSALAKLPTGLQASHAVLQLVPADLVQVIPELRDDLRRIVHGVSMPDKRKMGQRGDDDGVPCVTRICNCIGRSKLCKSRH